MRDEDCGPEGTGPGESALTLAFILGWTELRLPLAVIGDTTHTDTRKRRG